MINPDMDCVIRWGEFLYSTAPRLGLYQFKYLVKYFLDQIPTKQQMMTKGWLLIFSMFVNYPWINLVRTKASCKIIKKRKETRKDAST